MVYPWSKMDAYLKENENRNMTINYAATNDMIEWETFWLLFLFCRAHVMVCVGGGEGGGALFHCMVVLNVDNSRLFAWLCDMFISHKLLLAIQKGATPMLVLECSLFL